MAYVLKKMNGRSVKAIPTPIPTPPEEPAFTPAVPKEKDAEEEAEEEKTEDETKEPQKEVKATGPKKLKVVAFNGRFDSLFFSSRVCRIIPPF